MAKRGPKPTPFKVLQARGSWRAQGRQSGENLDQKRPACPKRLIKKRQTEDGETIRRVAKATWYRLAPGLHAAGLLVDKDREMFELLCGSFGLACLADAKIDSEGAVTPGSTGSLVKSPWVSIRDGAVAQVIKLAACFGLSPADIAGVRALEKPAQDDGKSKFFGRAS